MSTRPYAICVLFGAQIIQSLTLSQLAVCDDLPAIIAAWKQRQAEATGVLVEWEEDHKEVDIDWIRNHAKDPISIELIETKGFAAFVAKAPPLAYHKSKQLLITDACYRYSLKGPREIDGVKQPQDLDILFDGEKTVHYSAAYKQGGHPSANVYEMPKQMAFNSNYLPIILLSRPFDSRLGGIAVENLSFISNDESIDGRQHVLIESKAIGPAGSLRLWVDPASDFVPVRIGAFRDKKPFFQIDIEYGMTKETKHPSGWRIENFGSSPIEKSMAIARVKSWSTSKELGIERFQVRFPVGTTVSEFGEEGERQYVIREDEESP